MNSNTIKQAFYRSIPVMAGYIVLGIGFGILMRGAGYGVLWTASMSAFIYAGSMQYVGVGLLTGGASVLTTAMTTIMVNARHLFYSISMIDNYKDAVKYKPYMIFALTDETYSLLCGGTVPDGVEPELYRFLVSLFDHSYWVSGSIIGSLLGAVLPFSTEGIEFSMTALFVASFSIGPGVVVWLALSELMPSRIRANGMAIALFVNQMVAFAIADKVLPPAIIGMLVIYCLKDITPSVQPYGIPEFAATVCVVGMQVWRRNSLISILTGTVIYMVLIQTVFRAI